MVGSLACMQSCSLVALVLADPVSPIMSFSIIVQSGSDLYRCSDDLEAYVPPSSVFRA